MSDKERSGNQHYLRKVVIVKLKQAAILILVVLLVIIVIQNSNVADVHLLFWKVSMSMIILIFSTALIGFAIGYLSHHFIMERRKNR